MQGCVRPQVLRIGPKSAEHAIFQSALFSRRSLLTYSRWRGGWRVGGEWHQVWLGQLLAQQQ